MKISVLDLLEETYKKYPQRVAIQDEIGEITYAELRNKALSICKFIQSKTIEKHRPVFVLLPKDRMNIPVFMGILYSGNIYCPSEIIYPINKIVSLVNVLKPIMIITTKAMKEKLSDINHSVIIESIEDISFDDTLDINHTFYSNIISTDPVYILFTSGSTGVPKGVVINNENILDYIDWVRETFEFDEKDIFGNQAPFYFDNSTLDIYTSISCGACLSIIPKRLFSFPIELMEYVAEKKITTIFWVPSVLASVANNECLKNVDELKIKKVLFAGEVLQTKHLNYWMRNLKDVVYANLYGPTEITVDCTFYIVKKMLDDDEPIPIGNACRNTRVYLLNKNYAVITEKHVMGEIAVEGISVSAGYWDNEIQTAEHFVQNPFVKEFGQKIYLTGDLGYYNDENQIVYVGRKDSQIKHMGYRIELGEIETIASGNEHVKMACVLYENSKIVLICETDSLLIEKDMKKYLRGYLPKYMIPDEIIFVDKMPLNDNGKIDRNKIREGIKSDK